MVSGQTDRPMVVGPDQNPMRVAEKTVVREAPTLVRLNQQLRRKVVDRARGRKSTAKAEGPLMKMDMAGWGGAGGCHSGGHLLAT